MVTYVGRKLARGFIVVEVLAVAAVLGGLLTLGYSVWRGARSSARVVQAVGNLRQISVALELFFIKYSSYPPQGADLVAVLAPYVRDVNVFRNPLVDEETPGQTLSQLYREPSLREIDSPGNYITAFVSSDGSMAVVLSSGARVKNYAALSLPNDPASVVAILSSSDSPNPEPEGDSVVGDVNIDPTDSDSEFDLVRPDGTHITRDDLKASDGSLAYSGPAVWVRLKPKGTGNQSTLTLNGQVCQLDNGSRYVILALQGGSMAVNLYNSKAGQGKAMGKWWIAINATGAKVIVCTCQEECHCVEDSM